MDHGRRRRNRSFIHSENSALLSRSQHKPWSVLGGVYGLLILTTIISVIYMILEYHCTTCKTQSNINNITKHIEDIAENLSYMKMGYKNLEEKINKFSLEIPKVEEQVGILESMASSVHGSFWKNSLPSEDTHRVVTSNNLKNLSAKVMDKLKRRPHVTPRF